MDGGLGLPVSRNGLSSQQQPRLSNWTSSSSGSPKPPSGPTVIEEPFKKLKKPSPQSQAQSRSTTPTPSNNGVGKTEGDKKQGGEGRGMAASTSNKSLSDSSCADTTESKVWVQPASDSHSYKALTRPVAASHLWPPPFQQDSIGTKSAPVGQTPSTPRKGANGLPSPAKSLERSQSAEEQKPKIKPPALNNITAEATSTMSPPPAKKLALSAKKVTVSSHIIQSYWPLLCLTVFLQPTCLINHVSALSPFPLICPFFLTISNSSLPYFCLLPPPSIFSCHPFLYLPHFFGHIHDYFL